MPSADYDPISKDYAAIAKIDPVKQFVQYPSALKLLGNPKGKTVLDIGCGDGLLTREIARRGAKVLGYDISEEQIKLALAEEEKNPLGIDYLIADPINIQSKIQTKFDRALSVLVLLYARDREHLGDFFQSTHNLLNDHGNFASITYNPDYTKWGVPAFNRTVTKEDGKLRIEFLDDAGNIKLSASATDLSKEDYEVAASQAGFSKLEWINLKIEPEGVKKLGKEFWQDFEEDCPVVGLRVRK
jgi:cyclopropane fatty-acyl-phospholipid synthase-like methyltransferase